MAYFCRIIIECKYYDSKKVRVRFAPSPTGALHIGGVRTALYNYLFAKQNGGDMILRIEDTDSQRFVPGAEDYIIEALTWLGIKFDEGVSFGGNYGPYRQSERREIYKKYVDQLLNDGHAYIAFDTPAELEEKRKEIANFPIRRLYPFANAQLVDAFSGRGSEPDRVRSSVRSSCQDRAE